MQSLPRLRTEADTDLALNPDDVDVLQRWWRRFYGGADLAAARNQNPAHPASRPCIELPLSRTRTAGAHWNLYGGDAASDLQTQAEAVTSGEVHLTHRATQAARRGAIARGQHHDGVDAQIRRGYGPRRRLSSEQSHGGARYTESEQHASTQHLGTRRGHPNTLRAHT